MTPRALIVAVGLLVSTAGAQDLGAYRQLSGALDGAVRARASSAQAALTQLDAAQVAFEQLRPTLRNRQLSSGLEDALTGARAALGRTPAELEAQVLLGRGLMRKALYDQTLSQLISGTPGNGAQLQLLTREYGLSETGARAALTEGRAGQLERVAWRLQRAAAGRVLASLQAARPEQTTAAYVNLARATGWFTALPDAGAAGGLQVSQFGDALRQLTAGNIPELTRSLSTLRQGAGALSASLTREPQTSSFRKPAASASAAPLQVTGGSGPAPVRTPPPPAVTRPVAAAVSDRGRPEDAARLYAALGRALAAAGHGENAAARAHLSEAAQALSAAPGSLRTAPGYTALVFNLSAAQTRLALRPTDVQALIGQAANLEALAAGRPASRLDAASAGTARVFSGWLRVLVFALLALLSAVPLYLLNLAFGARNASWRAVLLGLTLLLLPTVLEGVFGLLGALGDLANLGALRSLTNLTLGQAAYGLPVWALLSALAIGLLAYGFRGLCQQFGLLGSSPLPKTTTQHGLEWDEEL